MRTRGRSIRGARTGWATTTAAAPSLSSEQSRRRYGLATTGDASTSATSMRIGLCASGFAHAFARLRTATAAHCAAVVPWRAMCIRIDSA